VRVTLYAGGHKTGLIDGELYGIYDAGESGPLQVTYGWKENGQLKTHTEKVAAGAKEQKWTVPTGKSIRDEFVRIAAE